VYPQHPRGGLHQQPRKQTKAHAPSAAAPAQPTLPSAASHAEQNSTAPAACMGSAPPGTRPDASGRTALSPVAPSRGAYACCSQASAQPSCGSTAATRYPDPAPPQTALPAHPAAATTTTWTHTATSCLLHCRRNASCHPLYTHRKRNALLPPRGLLGQQLTTNRRTVVQ
jgi:hypothetical protein